MSSPESKKRTLEPSQDDGGEESSERSKRISLSPTATTALPPTSTGQAPATAAAGTTDENIDNDESDSDVEYLFTLPPDPPRPQSSDSNHKSESLTDSTTKDPELDTTLGDGQNSMQSGSVTPAPAATATAQKTSNSSTTQPPPQPLYSHRSSAYLQTLAEICHAILWDGRWRVGGSKADHLFAWERGEDLSAMHYLARRYIIPNEDRESSSKEHDVDAAEAPNEIHARQHNNEANEEDDELDRCLETYCRLYFRKGPWFRLDNIYSSYYLPKRQTPQNTTDSNVDNTSPKQEAAAKKPMSPSKFFLPASQRPKKVSQANSNKKLEAYIDQVFVDQQLESVRVMLCDIQKLSSMGLIRFFHSEEECGKTVGNTERYQTSSSILRQDEQRSILAMLGGKNRKRPSPTASNSGSEKTGRFSFDNRSNKGSQPSENLIWKQMCQQQTIFKSFTTTSSSDANHILPVAKHVHRTLVEKWAASIVLKASKVEYIPSAIHRQATKAVCDKLMGWTNAFGDHILTAMCCRLREAPLETLRRACRLYLCATSGPGDMRGDGTNAWRSLPDKYPTKDLRKLPMRTNNVPPPGSNSWHMLSYPGKDWRMRLFGCNFIHCYLPLGVDDLNSANQVFSSVKSFHLWESGVELRANGDYLLELNDLLHYTERKQAREAGATGRNHLNKRKEDSASDDDSDAPSDDDKKPRGIFEVDFLDLLTAEGRDKVLRQFLNENKDNTTTIRNVESTVGTLLATSAATSPRGEVKCRLENECEKVLGVIAALLIHILEIRNATASQNDISRVAERPWLRHLRWEGCLAYLLWDMIPILERRGYYALSIDALEVLLFGKRLPKNDRLVPESLISVGGQENPQSLLATGYLSRRARGKAYERLIIDYIHLLRKSSASSSAKDGDKDKKPAPKGKKKTGAKGKKRPKSTKKEDEPPPLPTPNEIAMSLTEPLLRSRATETGRITFAAMRTLARRLKRPLSHTLHRLNLYETQELGHRLSNGSDVEEPNEKYSDWTPTTDTTVANAMSNDTTGAGARCAYVGFEEDEQNTVYTGSLNVEELAMEYYHQGRLPLPDPSDKSAAPAEGWKGYHDEGGRIRALFRILSSETLGMDWAQGDKVSSTTQDELTIHLTPYQGAPFDLHVGAELRSDKSMGFYQRRKRDVDSFLEKLASLDSQAVSDLVYDSINRRFEHAKSTSHFDPSLERDVLQVRTLSMLASGFGGKMLAAIFRCLFFDYRHYSGGLPDLTLFRAVYNSGDLVDLGGWVGETFSSDYQAALNAERAASILGDRDEEFLGCAKVGDSGGRNMNRFSRSSRRIASSGPSDGGTSENGPDKPSMPSRLVLEHNEQSVTVECMCVEVKSQNDRLDPRQEDWLNILSQHGNARVCKFEKPKKEKAKPTKEKKAKAKPAKGKKTAAKKQK